jgi:hypothetical protein
MLVLDLVSLYFGTPVASFITDLTLSTGSSLPTSPTQLTKVNCALCGKVVYMSPEAIQAEENRRQSIVITDSPTTPTTNSIQNSVATPSPQRSISGSWAASKFLKGFTLPSLGGVVAGATGSRSNPPTPPYSLDSATQNGSGPVTPMTATLERLSSPPLRHRFKRSFMPSAFHFPASQRIPPRPTCSPSILHNLPKIMVHYTLFAIPAGVLPDLRPPVSSGVM